MYVQLITPDKRIFEGEAIAVSMPGTDGSFQVLNRHADLVATLINGKINIQTADNKKRTFQVAGGVSEMLANRLVILAETAVESE